MTSSGGYPSSWFLVDRDVVHTYTCAMCFAVVKDPPNLDCSHLFCASCISRLQKRECPTCRTDITGELRSNVFVRTQIQSFPIQCPSRACTLESTQATHEVFGWKSDGDCTRVPSIKPSFTEGLSSSSSSASASASSSSSYCSWEGIMGMDGRNLRKHFEECDYALVSCPQQCSAQILRAHIFQHVERSCPRRQIVCPACQEEMHFADFVSLLHVDTSMQVRLLESNCQSDQNLADMMTNPCKHSARCLNTECNRIIAQKDFIEHSDKCDHRPMTCIVCEVPVPLSQFQQHLLEHGGTSVIDALVTWSAQVSHLRHQSTASISQPSPHLLGERPVLPNTAVSSVSSSSALSPTTMSSTMESTSSPPAVTPRRDWRGLKWADLSNPEREAWQHSRKAGDKVENSVSGVSFTIHRVHRRMEPRPQTTFTSFVFYYTVLANGLTKLVKVHRSDLQPTDEQFARPLA